MPKARLGSIELHYERAGEGAPLLFISGSGGDLRVKPNVFDGPLVKAFDVLAYDQRGLGRSEKPDDAYTMADYADDAAALMEQAGWASAKVIGVSFGGMVAQELVLRHPAKVERLVLACTSPGGAGGASYPFHDIQHLKGEARAKFLILIPISDTRRGEAWANPYAGEPGREMGARRQLEARADLDTWERLPDIRCPVLIAAGRYDGIALPATQERMAARIPGAELQFFDGGHLFIVQDRTALPAIIAFLNG
jgi:3-oxoadipate enol-lactonase